MTKQKIISAALAVALVAGGVVLFSLGKAEDWAGMLIAAGLTAGGVGTAFAPRLTEPRPEEPPPPVPADAGGDR